jgi:hypothetical protein
MAGADRESSAAIEHAARENSPDRTFVTFSCLARVREIGDAR